jgi:hypothetical protein
MCGRKKLPFLSFKKKTAIWDDHHHTEATKRVSNMRGDLSNESQIHSSKAM